MAGIRVKAAGNVNNATTVKHFCDNAVTSQTCDADGCYSGGILIGRKQMEETRVKTKYPILMLHGVGFRDLKWPLY